MKNVIATMLVFSSLFFVVSSLGAASRALANSTTNCTSATGSLTYSQSVVGFERETAMPQDGGQWTFLGKKVQGETVPAIDGANVMTRGIHLSLDRSSKTIIETHLTQKTMPPGSAQTPPPSQTETTYIIKALVRLDAFAAQPAWSQTEIMICEQVKN